MLNLVLALALSAAQQDAPVRPELVLTDLVESTNALPHFRAHYAMQRGDDQTGSFELAYLAPDRLSLRSESPKGSGYVVISEGELWVDMQDAAGAVQVGSVDVYDRGGEFEELLELQSELFPLAQDALQLSVLLSWGFSNARDELDLELQVRFLRMGAANLLGWLDTVQRADGELRLEGELLRHESEGVRARIDVRTGFLTELDARTSDGRAIRLVLEKLDLEVAPEASEFVRPVPSSEAEDVTLALREQLLDQTVLRAEVLRLTNRRLLEGDAAWEGELQVSLQALLTALHEPVLRRKLTPWVSEMERSAVDACALLRSARERGEPRERLVEAAAARREQLVELLEATRERLQAGLPAAPSSGALAPRFEDVLTLEATVFRAVFERLASAPVLEAWDIEVASVLEL